MQVHKEAGPLLPAARGQAKGGYGFGADAAGGALPPGVAVLDAANAGAAGDGGLTMSPTFAGKRPSSRLLPLSNFAIARTLLLGSKRNTKSPACPT